MEPSLPGLIVCGLLLAFGWRLGAPILVALFASLPLSSTAFATLPALGGATPLVYTLVALLFIASVVLRPGSGRRLGRVFRREPTAWLVLGLLFYSLASAVILPRLFAGETSAFVVHRGGVLELPLAPTFGNITQTAYFALGAVAFFCLLIELQGRAALRAVHTGFFAYLVASVALGIVDLGAKVAGLGDVLSPIRTANYSLLTEVAAGSFWRLTGATPEASTFAIGMLACVAFATVYWRTTGDRLALLLAILAFLLCLLSTSTTAYLGLALLGLLQGFMILRKVISGRVGRRDAAMAACLPVLLVAILGIYVAKEKALDPVVQLVDTMVIKKGQSDSAKEREYWNRRSLAALSDTHGLGTGFGSSRASSWVIAVISQLGLVGAVLMGLLTATLLRDPGSSSTHDPTALGLYRGARAAALAFLVGVSLSGGSADPGILFFLCLAVVVTARQGWPVRPGPRWQPMRTARA